MNEISIVMARSTDAKAYAQHLKRHFSESLIDRDFFHPYDHVPHFQKQDNLDKMKSSWALDVSKEGWERVWLAWKVDQVVGHVDLKFRKLMNHRSHLGIGLERAHRGQGLGRMLMQTAIEWARPQFDWVDLQVFDHNKAAIKLYKSLGFEDRGTICDLFRIDGKSIDDHSMVLKLK